MAGIQELNPLQIPLNDVKSATNNFSNDNFIGVGGFGPVYKGRLGGLPSTTEVAVKRLDRQNNSGQGQREFLSEIVMLARYKHDNLVSLIGFSDEEKEKVLIYKYEVNGSLDKHLGNAELDWEQRLRICLGAARGLEYLHDGEERGHRVLHRDIKSANILLDEKWEAKISDFGLCKIGPSNQKYSFLVTHAAGTPGYVDPQYSKTGILTKESDVYSFGVVLFEVVCGTLVLVDHKYDDTLINLIKLVKRCYKEDKLDEIIMASLRERMVRDSLETFTQVAYRCLHEDRKQRPTMKTVVQELQKSLTRQTGGASSGGIENFQGGKSKLWGSKIGGVPWSLRLEGMRRLKKITIDHWLWIWSIRFTTQELSGSSTSSLEYTTQELSGSSISALEYGGTDGRSRYGQLAEIYFEDDEEIIEIFGTAGATQTGYLSSTTLVTSLCLITNKNRQHGPFGRETGTPFSKKWDVGSFDGFHGRGGFYLDAIGFYTKFTV